MVNKFKRGDIIIGTKEASQHYNITCEGYIGIVIRTHCKDGSYICVAEYDCEQKKRISDRNQYIVESKYFIHYKTKTMAKKKTGEIIPKTGMYFTATRNRKKIRGVISSCLSSHYTSHMYVILVGKDFNHEEDEGEFPKYDEISYDNTELTFEEALKKELSITNFVVCTDKRQKAVIDGDKCPFFGPWRVNLEGVDLIFGCGKVQVSVKNAKTFVEMFCDYGESDTIAEYAQVVFDEKLGDNVESNYLESYYQVRKYLEENYTTAQIDVFNDVLDQILKSGEQEVEELECSSMRELLKKF